MFEGAKLKIERANHHIQDLRTQFTAFVEANPYRVAVAHNPETGKAAIRLIFGQDIPAAFALTIGDVIHNLRTALDHMTWEMVGRDGGTQDRYLKFPTGDNRVNFESSCQGIVTTSQSIRDLLKTLEVFPSGNGDLLYSLHLLDNADKHTVLTPMIRAAMVSKFVIHNADGTVQGTFKNNIFAGGTGPYADIWDVPVGGYVELDSNTKADPTIFFGSTEAGVQFKPAFPALSRFRNETTATLDIVERSIT